MQLTVEIPQDRALRKEIPREKRCSLRSGTAGLLEYSALLAIAKTNCGNFSELIESSTCVYLSVHVRIILSWHAHAYLRAKNQSLIDKHGIRQL